MNILSSHSYHYKMYRPAEGSWNIFRLAKFHCDDLICKHENNEKNDVFDKFDV